jgi:hypothetical protein
MGAERHDKGTPLNPVFGRDAQFSDMQANIIFGAEFDAERYRKVSAFTSQKGSTLDRIAGPLSMLPRNGFGTLCVWRRTGRG